MGINLKAGDKIPLAALITSRATDKVVRAIVRNEFGVEVTGSPISVAHLANGFYFDDSLAMPNTAHVSVEYDVFDGPGFTNPTADIDPDAERFDLDDIGTAIDQLVIAATKADLDAEVDDTDEIDATVRDGENMTAELTDIDQVVAEISDGDDAIGVQLDDDGLTAQFEEC